jgi:hypothetical protein
MIGYIVKVKVSLSRDPECNPFTLVESRDFGIDRPTPDKLKAFIQECRQRYMDTYPTRQGRPIMDALLPTDVEVIDLDTLEKLAVAS